MWNVLADCINKTQLKWTEVSRALNVSVSTINTQRKYARDIEFGFLVSLLELLGCSLRLSLPPKSEIHPSIDGHELTLALRGLLRKMPTTDTLLQYEKAGTSKMADLFDELSKEDREMVYALAVRLKNGKPSDN